MLGANNSTNPEGAAAAARTSGGAQVDDYDIFARRCSGCCIVHSEGIKHRSFLADG